MDKQTWNVSDIAGSNVYDDSGECIGVLMDVLPTGANDVWVIKTGLNASGEILLPALKTVVNKIDVEAKKIYVTLPAGLKDVFKDIPAGKVDDKQKQSR